MSEIFLRTIRPDSLPDLLREPVDPETTEQAQRIVDQVRARGEAALRELAELFREVTPGGSLVLTREELLPAWEGLAEEERALLQRVKDRIEGFAQAQRDALEDVTVPLPGGVAGHQVAPVETAGCYAPGGRFPLPSTMLMTVATARAAGVKTVVAASPGAAPITRAAAYIAGADMLLLCGGAHAIAALAHGVEGLVPRCDVVVGPGNRWVTAAKKIVSGSVGIDLLAGPSELVVLADDTADPDMVAVDLLAQAEHDPDALPILVTVSEDLIAAVNSHLRGRLAKLPARETAEASLLNNGFAVLAADLDEAVDCVNRLAPEHLEVLTADAERVSSRVRHYGGLFIGPGAAEVLGDYGAGPNHTLPTGNTARYTGGLSVFNFLRVRTWMCIDDTEAATGLVEDSAALARLEGLEAHALSALKRRSPSS